MKTWFAKFKISNGLDRVAAARAPSEQARKKSAEVRRFESTMGRLDAGMRATRPPLATPVDLHASIMRAVLAKVRKQEAARPPFVWRWLPAPAAALVLGLCAWWFVNRAPSAAGPPATQPLFVAAAALAESHQWTERAPSVALAPLAQELESVQEDLRGAVKFLFASVP